MTWLCDHRLEQQGGVRCIRCCVEHPRHYVLCAAAGGTPERLRWLCDRCREVYHGLGLLVCRSRQMPEQARPNLIQPEHRTGSLIDGRISNGQRAMLGAQARRVRKLRIVDAAQSAGVSVGRVGEAAVVLEWAPELADQVVAGGSLNAAYAVAQKRKAARRSLELANEEIGAPPVMSP